MKAKKNCGIRLYPNRWTGYDDVYILDFVSMQEPSQNLKNVIHLRIQQENTWTYTSSWGVKGTKWWNIWHFVPGVDGWSGVLPSAKGLPRAHTKGVGVPFTWVLSPKWCGDFKLHSQTFLTHSPW